LITSNKETFLNQQKARQPETIKITASIRGKLSGSLESLSRRGLQATVFANQQQTSHTKRAISSSSATNTNISQISTTTHTTSNTVGNNNQTKIHRNEIQIPITKEYTNSGESSKITKIYVPDLTQTAVSANNNQATSTATSAIATRTTTSISTASSSAMTKTTQETQKSVISSKSCDALGGARESESGEKTEIKKPKGILKSPVITARKQLSEQSSTASSNHSQHHLTQQQQQQQSKSQQLRKNLTFGENKIVEK
jgi:hypothetical protein